MSSRQRPTGGGLAAAARDDGSAHHMSAHWPGCFGRGRTRKMPSRIWCLLV